MNTIPLFIFRLSLSLIAFITGIMAQTTFAYPLIISITFFVLFLIALIVFYHSKKNQHYLYYFLLGLFFSGGMAIYAIHWQTYVSFKKIFSTDAHSFQGVIHAITEKPTKYAAQSIIFNYTSVQKEGEENWSYCPGTLELYVQEKSNLEIGDTLKLDPLKIKYCSSSKKMTNTPSFEYYLAKEGKIACVHVKKLAYSNHARPNYSVRRSIMNTKEKLYSSLQEKLSPSSFSLFSTIFLGTKKNDSFANSYLFSLWGISHYLARSGLHMVIIIGLLEFFMILFPLHIFIKRIIIVLFCILYWQLSWNSISFLRAFLIYLFSNTAVLLKKKYIFLYTLLLLFFLTLALNPFYLFFLDFQLTFLLTLALSWFNYYKIKLQPY